MVKLGDDPEAIVKVMSMFRNTIELTCWYWHSLVANVLSVREPPNGGAKAVHVDVVLVAVARVNNC